MQMRKLVGALTNWGMSLFMEALRIVNQHFIVDKHQQMTNEMVLAAYDFNTIPSSTTSGQTIKQKKIGGDTRDRLLRCACYGLTPVTIPDSMKEFFQKITGANLYYSQEGEDILVERLVGVHTNGFYVDIGAHHATRFSNTFSLYLCGWRGINVDVTPGSMASFQKLRPRDINIEAAVSDRKGRLHFHFFRESALNTADVNLAQSYVAHGYEMMGEADIPTRTLASILDEHLPAGTDIDLLSLDVEGEDLAALRSGDWERYQPTVVIIEVLDTPFAQLMNNPAVLFLMQFGYEVRSRLFNSVILSRKNV